MFKSALSGLEAQRNDMNEFVQQFLENPEKTTYHHECFELVRALSKFLEKQ